MRFKFKALDKLPIIFEEAIKYTLKLINIGQYDINMQVPVGLGSAWISTDFVQHLLRL